jgi:hypothetical protein
MKCFTFGKKVKRQVEDDGDRVSRVDILKKRFQRLSLLRQYFSVNKRELPRKFKYPICEDSQQIDDKPFQIYDELQYAEESDVEECMRPPRKEKKEPIATDDLEVRSHSVDLDFLESASSKRIDLKFIKGLKNRLHS